MNRLFLHGAIFIAGNRFDIATTDAPVIVDVSVRSIVGTSDH